MRVRLRVSVCVCVCTYVSLCVKENETTKSKKGEISRVFTMRNVILQLFQLYIKDVPSSVTSLIMGYPLYKCSISL